MAGMKFLLPCLLIFSTFANGQEFVGTKHRTDGDEYGWLKENFPDPKIDPSSCRTRSGLFCDPDSILVDPEDLYKLEKALCFNNRTYSLPCHGNVRAFQQNSTIPVSVAFLRKVNLSHLADKNVQEKEVEAFARHVYQTWNRDAKMKSICDGSAILIVMVEEDHLIYIARGSALASILTDARVQLLIAQLRPLLRRKRYADAVVDLLEGIHFFSLYGESRPSQAQSRLLSTLGYTICLLLAAIRLYRSACQRKKYYQLQRSMQWDDLSRRIQAEMLQRRFKAESCPICLGTFPSNDGEKDCFSLGSDGQPLKLLRCGHVFDASCWVKWERTCYQNGTITRCLLCRQHGCCDKASKDVFIDRRTT